MQKRFVVFVSSTYLDLIHERQEVSKALISFECFPAQMENWPAMDAGQMEAIRQIIDDSDYFLILTAGKYGSCDPQTGLSYTEMEYDYALSVGKPIIRLVHQSPFSSLSGDKIEIESEKRKKLEKFHSKLKQSSVCALWSSPQDLANKTLLSLNDIIRRHPRGGWVRAELIEAAKEQEFERSIVDKLLDSLRLRERELEQTFGLLPIPLLKISVGGRILVCSEGAREIIGFDPSRNSNIEHYLDGLGRPFEDWFREVVNGTDPISSRFLRGRGAFANRFVQFAISKSKEGGDFFIYAVLSDVTELKALETQFIQSQRMQAIGQLAEGISFDFDEILASISSHCDRLLLRRGNVGQAHDDIVAIHQNANRAKALVAQLLAFARRQDLQREEIALQKVISEITYLLNRLVGEAIRLVIDFDKRLSAIRGDKRQIEQIFTNMVANARDAMPNGGEIHIRLRNLKATTRIERPGLSVPIGDYVAIEFLDNGHGIPPGNLPKVFEPFFTTKRVGEGTGLGLSAVYGIVKQSGGYIGVESDLEKGTKFSLFFPAVESSEAQRED